MSISKIEDSNYVEFYDSVNKEEIFHEFFPPSLNFSNFGKDEILKTYECSDSYYDEIDCVIKSFELRKRIKKTKDDDTFYWLLKKDNNNDDTFLYVFMNLHDISCFAIKNVTYHLVDSDGKRIDNINYKIYIGYDTNDCFGLIAVIPAKFVSVDLKISIDEVTYDGAYSSTVLTKKMPVEATTEIKNNEKCISKVREPILKKARQEISDFNKDALSYEKIHKFDISKIDFNPAELINNINLFKKQLSFKREFRNLHNSEYLLIEGRPIVDKIFKSYPLISYCDKRIKFFLKIEYIMDSFFGLAGLLDEITVLEACIDENNVLKLIFEVGESDHWLLICLYIWLVTQGNGYYGIYTGKFYQSNILGCFDRLYLEDFDKELSFVFNNLEANRNYYDYVLDTYYYKILNRKFLEYTRNSQVWKSELLIYLFSKFFFNDSIHVFTSEWLGNQSIDIYIPSIELAIEFQGEQHTSKGHFAETDDDFERIKQRDIKKRECCIKNGVKLVEIFYYEDYSSITKFSELLNSKLGVKMFSLEKKRNNYGNPKFKDLLQNIHGNH